MPNENAGTDLYIMVWSLYVNNCSTIPKIGQKDLSETSHVLV